MFSKDNLILNGRLSTITGEKIGQKSYRNFFLEMPQEILN